jgi:serine/threonine-protein kinase
MGEPGSLIGPYELLKPLGGGSMGVVYLAWESSPPREVALKIIAEGLVSRDYIDYFVAEMEYQGRLQHPNIVQIFNSGHHDGRLYFTMTYCRGGDLDDVIKEHGTLEPTQAARYVSHIAGAVQYFHDKGDPERGRPTIHGDLKPKNILLNDCRDDKFPYGLPYVADFGVAGLLRDISPGSAPGFSVGTLHYMSPEQADGRQAVGPASDVWGLGVILFECLTGSLPFRGDTEAETRYQILHRETPSLRAIRPDIPRVLQLICLKCLKKRPEDRYRSASELVKDLGCFRREEPLIHAQPETLWERFVQWTRRVPALAARLAVIVACSVILWGYRVITGGFAPLEKGHWIWNLVIDERVRASGRVEPITVCLNQVILVAWGLASWAFQRQLTRQGQDGGLQFGWRVVDVLALSLLIQMDDALMSPLTVAFAVLIVASAFWAQADQILQATLLSMCGYLALVLAYIPGHSGLLPNAYRHFHYLVGLALLGAMLTHLVNRMRALARI